MGSPGVQRPASFATGVQMLQVDRALLARHARVRGHSFMGLSILSRLFLGYVFLLVIAANMSAYAIVKLGDVTDVAQSIIQADNPLIMLHKELTDALLSETRYEKKYLIVRDQALYEGFLKSRGDFEHELNEALQLDIPDSARAALHAAADAHLNYISLFSNEVDYLKDGQTYARSWYADEKEQAVNTAIDELMKVRLAAQSAMFTKVRNLTKAGREARNLAMIVSAVTLLAGLVLAVVITRSITRPLAEIRKKTKDIADGVLEPDLAIGSPPEIGALAQAINSMCGKLREVDKMKYDFFALMSHELRTPLTAIKEGTNLFLEGKGGPVTDRQKRLLTIVSEESNRLIALVNSVLDLSRLEAGMLVWNFSRADLTALINRVAGEMGPLAEAKGIRIVKQLGELPHLNIDAERMLQALRNLIGNALKFTPRSGAVTVSARQEDRAVIVSVADTGPGIPKDHLAGIFDKFHQAPGPGRSPGTGLGLAIVKNIIQAHGGAVWAESEPGGGSTFIFRLPV